MEIDVSNRFLDKPQYIVFRPEKTTIETAKKTAIGTKTAIKVAMKTAMGKDGKATAESL